MHLIRHLLCWCTFATASLDNHSDNECTFHHMYSTNRHRGDRRSDNRIRQLSKDNTNLYSYQGSSSKCANTFETWFLKSWKHCKMLQSSLTCWRWATDGKGDSHDDSELRGLKVECRRGMGWLQGVRPVLHCHQEHQPKQMHPNLINIK